jgi:hypothetical protein
MRYVVALLGLLAYGSISSPVHAGEFVNGYIKNDGTYVQPHMKSSPDGNVWNNWSTKGNVNHYTGQPGTKNPYSYGSSGYSNFGTFGSGNQYGSQNFGYDDN